MIFVKQQLDTNPLAHSQMLVESYDLEQASPLEALVETTLSVQKNNIQLHAANKFWETYLPN